MNSQVKANIRQVGMAVLLLSLALPAWADSSYSISTGALNDGNFDSRWTVTSVPIGAPVPSSTPKVVDVGSTGTTSLATAGTAAPYAIGPGGVNYGFNASLSTVNAGWTGGPGVQALDPQAQWISADADGASSGIYGLYEYSLTLNVAPGDYVLSGLYTSDNSVVDFTVNGTDATVNPTGNSIYDFRKTFGVSGNGSGTPITLKVVVYNEANLSVSGLNKDLTTAFNDFSYTVPDTMSGPTAWDTTANPTGFILAGSLTMVPVAESVWLALPLLGMLMTLHVLRRCSTA